VHVTRDKQYKVLIRNAKPQTFNLFSYLASYLSQFLSWFMYNKIKLKIKRNYAEKNILISYYIVPTCYVQHTERLLLYAT